MAGRTVGKEGGREGGARWSGWQRGGIKSNGGRVPGEDGDGDGDGDGDEDGVGEDTLRLKRTQ